MKRKQWKKIPIKSRAIQGQFYILYPYSCSKKPKFLHFKNRFILKLHLKGNSTTEGDYNDVFKTEEFLELK